LSKSSTKYLTSNEKIKNYSSILNDKNVKRKLNLNLVNLNNPKNDITRIKLNSQKSDTKINGFSFINRSYLSNKKIIFDKRSPGKLVKHKHANKSYEIIISLGEKINNISNEINLMENDLKDFKQKNVKLINVIENV
jgi:hypothetical protein